MRLRGKENCFLGQGRITWFHWKQGDGLPAYVKALLGGKREKQRIMVPELAPMPSALQARFVGEQPRKSGILSFEPLVSMSRSRHLLCTAPSKATAGRPSSCRQLWLWLEAINISIIPSYGCRTVSDSIYLFGHHVHVCSRVCATLPVVNEVQAEQRPGCVAHDLRRKQAQLELVFGIIRGMRLSETCGKKGRVFPLSEAWGIGE